VKNKGKSKIDCVKILINFVLHAKQN
jgi:hypothetical protein